MGCPGSSPATPTGRLCWIWAPMNSISRPRPSPVRNLFCPANVVAVAPQGQNAVAVTYPPPDATPVAAVMTAPPAGSVFFGGTNSVLCTAFYDTNVLNCTFTVTVVLWPTITVQPQSTNVLTGRDFTLSAAATGSTPMGYQLDLRGRCHPRRNEYHVHAHQCPARERGHPHFHRQQLRRAGDQPRRSGASPAGSPAHRN